jgi:acyl carrier protein
MARGAASAILATNYKGEFEGDMSNHTDRELRRILADVLGLKPAQVAEFDADTGLFGHLPELDSMSVAGLLTEMEDRLGFIIDDDEIDGELLETYGSLLAFAEAKRAAA